MTFKTLSDYYWKLPKIIAIPLLIILAVIVSFPTAILMLEYYYEFWWTIKAVTVVLIIIGGCFNYKKIAKELECFDVMGSVMFVGLPTFIFITLLMGIKMLSAMVVFFLVPILFVVAAILVNKKHQKFLILAYGYLVFLVFVSAFLIDQPTHSGSKGLLTAFFKKESTISDDYQKALRNLNLQVVNKGNAASSYAMEYINHYNGDIRFKSVEILAPFSSNSDVRKTLQTVALSLNEETYTRQLAICSIVESSHDYDDFLFKLLRKGNVYVKSLNLSGLPCIVSFSQKTQAELIDRYEFIVLKYAYYYREQVTNVMRNSTALRHALADEISQGQWAKFFRFGLLGVFGDLGKEYRYKQLSVLSNRTIILGDIYVENAFLKLMRSDDEDNISDAFEAMEKAYNYHREVEKILVNHLQSSDDDVVSRAKRLLLNYRITDWNSITAVLKIIDSGSAYDKESAFKLLTRSLPVYVKELETTISEQKQNIIKNVREKATRQCQHDMDADVRQAACQTLEVIE